MFLDQELKNIREAKNRVAICSDLRRKLVDVEIQGIRWGLHRSLSNLTLVLTVVEQVFCFLRDRKGNRP